MKVGDFQQVQIPPANRSLVPEGMSRDQFEEAQRLFEVTQQASTDEQWRICCLLASKEDGQLLGQTEFEMRDHLHR